MFKKHLIPSTKILILLLCFSFILIGHEKIFAAETINNFSNPSPSVGQTNVAHDVIFSWDFISPEIPASIYRVKINNNTECSSTPPTKSCTATTIAYNQSYTWYVEAYDSGGSSIDRSETWYFSTANQTITASSPTNGATRQSTDIPSLSWSSPVGSSYRLYFGESSNPSDTGCDTTGTSCTMEEILFEADFPSLNQSQTYYWKIIAIDGGRDIAESDVFSFTTEGIPAKPFEIENTHDSATQIGWKWDDCHGSL